MESVASSMESSVDESAVRKSTADHLETLGIPAVQAAQLFDASHTPGGVTPRLAAYFPFGCALAAFRFGLWIAGIALDAPWFRQKPVIDAWMALLGVTVTWSGEQHIPLQQRHVLVSNHVSVGDLLLLFQRPQRYVHLITNALPDPVYATHNLPAILLPANKEMYLLLAQANQQQQQLQQDVQQDVLQHEHVLSGLGHLHSSQQYSALSHVNGAGSHASDVVARHAMPDAAREATSTSSTTATSGSSSSRRMPDLAAAQAAPVHLFPEGGMTNGQGMMRFSRGFMLFADKLPVVPVALRLRTALPELKSHTMTSNFLANLFWFSFQPSTVIEAVALPAMSLAPGESKAAFVQRVQLVIAAELGAWVTDLSIQQKRQLVKKQQQQQKQQRKQR